MGAAEGFASDPNAVAKLVLGFGAIIGAMGLAVLISSKLGGST